MSHADHSHAPEGASDRRLLGAVALNLGLTVAEIAGGVISGSLTLLADALHNFSDCGALIVALIARRVARREPDERRTFGYRRAETVGAVINLTALLVVAFYLIAESIERFFQPHEIGGWTVVIVATVALAVDVGTVVLLAAMSKGSTNVRAAFLHNVSDALASVGAIVVGVVVIVWKFYAADMIVTLLIAGYILWQSAGLLRRSIAVLMEGAPDGLDLAELVAAAETVPGVLELHHVHVWQLDEQHRALEAHVVIEPTEVNEAERVKREVKALLKERFAIGHSTLELEWPGDGQPDHDTARIAPH